MAINAGTILAYLDLDTSKFGNAMQMAQSQMSDFSQTGGGVSGMLDGVGSAATTVGRAMTMGVTAPLLGVGTAIAKSAMGWETAFAGVRKTVNITSGDIEAGYKKIADGLTEMSTAKPVAAETLAGIAANAGQLGVAEEYILSFTGVMADLEVATNLTGEEAASMFAQYANITGMDLGQISNLGSTVVELGNNTATTERDIAEMMHRLAGAGSIVGLTDAQIAGMSATLTSLGINAEAGGSAMSRVLSGMNSAVIGGGKDLKAFASIAGVSSKEFASAWQADPINALQLFTQGLNNISLAGGDVDAALEAVGLNDIRITDMLKRLMGSGDMLIDTVEMANEAWEKNTALSEEAAKQYATTESKIQMLKNAVGNTAREFGNVLLPVIGKVVDWFTKCVQWVGNLDDGTKRLLVTAGGIAAAVGPALLVGGKLLGTFSGVLPVLGLVGGAFAMIYNHSDRLQGIVGKLKTGGLSAFGGLKDGVAAYNAAIAGGVSRTTAIGRAINTVFGASNGTKINGVIGKITTGVKAAGTAVRGTINGLGEFIGSLIDGEPVAASFENALQAAFGGNVPERVRNLQTSVAGFANQIKTDFATGGVIGVMQGLGARIADALQNGWGSMKIGLGNLREKIGEGLELARDWLEPKARQWMANLGDAYQNAKGYVVDKLPAVREAIANGLQVAKTKMTEVAKDALTWLGDAYRSGKVQEAIGTLKSVGENIVSKFNMGKTFLVEKAREWIAWLGEALGSDEVKEKLGDLSSVATKIGEKIASGLGSMKTTAATLLGELATQLIDSGFLSTAFTELAPVVTAIAKGLGTAASNMTSAAASLMGSLVTAMSNIEWAGLIDTVGTVASNLLGKLIEAIPGLTDSAVGLMDAIITGIGNINWASIGKSLSGVATKLLDGILDNLPATVENAGRIVDKIGQGIGAAGKALGEAANALVSGLVTWLLTPENWAKLLTVGGSLVEGIVNGIISIGGGLLEGAANLLIGIIDGIFHPMLEAAGLTWNEETQRVMDTTYEIVNAEGDKIVTAGSNIMAALAITPGDSVGLYNAVVAYGLACEQGIQDSFPQAQWLANDAVVGLFSIMIDTSADMGDRAKAMAALSMSGYGDLVANAIFEDSNLVFTAAGELVRGANDEVNAAVSELGSALPGAIGTGLESGIPILEKAQQRVAEIASGTQDKVDTIADAKKVGEEATTSLAEGQTAKEGEVTTSAQGVSDATTGTLEPLPGLMEAIAENGVAGMAEGITNKQDDVTTATQTVSDAAVDQALRTMSAAQGVTIGQGFGGGIVTGIQNKQSPLNSTARNVAMGGRNAMSGILNSGTGYPMGQNTIQGVINGAESMRSSLMSRFRSLASSAVSAFRNALQMHSPSLILTGDGAMMVRSIILGTDGMRKEAEKSMERLADGMQHAWPGVDLGVPKMTDNPNATGYGADGEGAVFNLTFTGDITVREEADIQKIGAELYDQFRDAVRGGGH